MEKELTLLVLAQNLFKGNKIIFKCEKGTWWCNIDFTETGDNNCGEDADKLELLTKVSIESDCKIQFNLGL